MKIIFMGTPDFAVASLQALIDSDNDVFAVFTQPDKPLGRKQIITPSPVKICAEKNNITVYQPDSLKGALAKEKIRLINPDLIVVAAYGKILPVEILKMPRYGCINVHASLLPKYRGAAPIQRAILNGDSQTGVTIMQMDEGLDTGAMLLAKKTDIDINETARDLFDRLSHIGASALLDAVNRISNNSAKPVEQDESKASYASKITKALCPIDWSRSALEIHNQVRGLQSWPCASTVINGKNVKIHKTELTDLTSDKAGMVTQSKEVLTVCCGDGKCINILELQAEGKKRMTAKAFLQGNTISKYTVLGE